MLSSILVNPAIQFSVLVLADVSVGVAFFRGRPSIRLLGHFCFFAILTALLVLQGIEPFDPHTTATTIPDRVFVAVAKTVWWIGGAMVLVSLVRLFQGFAKRSREGRLLQDVAVGLIYLGAALSVISYVFGVPVGTLIATSGVFAVILGLALQSTLNDVFSGIALNLGRPYSVGDWIEIADGVQGRVVETNWRATHLLKGSNDLIVIPNSTLAKTRLTNLSTPDETHGVSLSLKVAPVKSPAAVEEIMRTVLMSSNSILKHPAPTVTISGLDNNSISVDLSFRVGDRSIATGATNEIYDLAYRHCRAASLPFAGTDGQVVVQQDRSPETSISQHPSSAWKLLSSIPLFSALTEDEKESLSTSMVRKTYAKGSVIAEQDSKLSSLMAVRHGVLLVSRREHEVETELARLAPGDCFGEGGVLMGNKEVGRITALTFAVIYEIGHDCLANVMRDRPALAEELGILLSHRVEIEQQRIGAGHVSNDNHAETFANRIRHLFQLQRVA
jgi:small-conductance mechanosensitive channel/CRP-like cAMP-binding protein